MEVEPKGRRSLTEPEEWSPEAADGRRLTKVEPEGRGSPVEQVGCRATVETRELGAKAEPPGRRTEEESRTRRLEAEAGNPHAQVEVVTGSPAAKLRAQMARTEGELRD